MYNLLPVLASFAIFKLASSLSCPFPGPDLSQPKLLSGSSAFRSALENLTETLDSAAAGDINPGFLINQTSFSIIVTDAKQQLWSYHHTAPTTTNGTRHVGDHSQYRIASVTKMITNLLVLRLGLDLETKITHFLPELNKGNGGILWDRVTLRDLGSHMEGLQPLYGFPENYTLGPFYQQLGFPAVNASAYPLCEVSGLRPQLCTEESMFIFPYGQIPRTGTNLYVSVCQRGF
jgi:CubicO group peptidase (beta-lactamase class C family)